MASVAGRLSAVDVVDEASLMFRRHLTGPAWVYYVFTVPFVLGAVDFVSSLSAGVVLPGEIARRSFTLCLLFWLKSVGQTFYCRRSMEDLTRARPARPVPADLRLALLTGATQALMLPVSILSMFFFVTSGITCSMTQHLFILSAEPGMDLRTAIRKSYARSLEGVKLQHHFWGLTFVLYFFLYLNLSFFFYILPPLLKTFFNLDTVFSDAGFSMLNSTFIILILGLTYLCIDPIVKLSYVILNYQTGVRRTGLDILARLAELAPKFARVLAVAVVAAGAALTPAEARQTVHRQILDGPEDSRPARELRSYYEPLLRGYLALESARRDTSEWIWAADLLSETFTVDTVKLLKKRIGYLERRDGSGAGIVSAGEMDGAIKTVFAADKYRWRVAYEPEPEEKKDGPLHALFEWLGKPVKKVVRWLNVGIKKVLRWFYRILLKISPSTRSPAGSATSMAYYLELIGLGLIAILAAALAIALVRHRKKFIRPAPDDAPLRPDLEAADVDARAMGLDEWMTLSEQLAGESKFQLALRAVFLATLSRLNEKRLIRFELYKTNTDYLGELHRRTPPEDARRVRFGDMVRIFEKVWYGGRPVSVDLFHSFKAMNQAVVGEPQAHAV